MSSIELYGVVLNIIWNQDDSPYFEQMIAGDNPDYNDLDQELVVIVLHRDYWDKLLVRHVITHQPQNNDFGLLDLFQE